jgi:uncharacterized protein (DUF58 family)
MASPAVQDGLNRRYLRVQDLRRLRNVFFSSRRPVEGHYAGRHATPQRGHSVEFNDYRSYMPGDEMGDIDWKVFARSDKLFVKLFEHQSDMTVNLVVDGSASMGYAGNESGVHPWWDGGGKTPYRKYDHACLIAAAIAFLTTKQQDKVSLGVAREGLAEFHRPLGTFQHLTAVLRTLEWVQPGGRAGLAEALKQMAGQTGRRGLLVVLSDLWDDREEIAKALSIYLHRGSEVILFHVLHADELQLPDLGDAVFQDSESEGRLRLNVADVAPVYTQKLRNWLDGWSNLCQSRGIDYNLVPTSSSYVKALEQYLFNRAAMI